jgi:biotin transport system substrate-specific component
MNVAVSPVREHVSIATALTRRAVLPRWLTELLLIVCGTLLLAVCAQIAVPLWFTPVPMTGQTLGVMLIGALYGSRRAGATTFLYLAEGAAGLPVFAEGGSGAVHLLGPTGGYLFGFAIAAVVIGAFAERGWDRTFIRCAAAMTIGTIVVFIFGLLWLAPYVGWGHVVERGLLPFLLDGAIKIVLAAMMMPFGWKIMRLFAGP